MWGGHPVRHNGGRSTRKDKTMELAYITDPGHGWLLVTTGQLAEVDLTPDAFSRYSYQHGDVLALEEDCDMPVFLKAYEAKRKETPLIRARHLDHDAFVRSWPPL
jgi:hypothetical protein